MAGDIFNGPTSATSSWVAARRVATLRSHLTCGSRLACALCLLLAVALGAVGVSA